MSIRTDIVTGNSYKDMVNAAEALDEYEPREKHPIRHRGTTAERRRIAEEYIKRLKGYIRRDEAEHNYEAEFVTVLRSHLDEAGAVYEQEYELEFGSFVDIYVHNTQEAFECKRDKRMRSVQKAVGQALSYQKLSAEVDRGVVALPKGGEGTDVDNIYKMCKEAGLSLAFIGETVEYEL